jgi:hypothetical protein
MCSPALKRYSASDPRLRAQLPPDPMGSFFMRIFSTRCSRCTSECANIGAILSHLNASPEPTPHREWWKQFLRDTGGTGFGTNFILHSVALNQSMSMSSTRSVFFVLPRRYLRKGGVFSARERLHRDGMADTTAPYTEQKCKVRSTSVISDIRTSR